MLEVLITLSSDLVSLNILDDYAQKNEDAFLGVFGYHIQEWYNHPSDSDSLLQGPSSGGENVSYIMLQLLGLCGMKSMPVRGV